VDPRPFKIAVQQAEATAARDLATLKNAERDLARYDDLASQKLISQQQLDQQRATVDAARATLALDQAAVNNARLNLQFSSVTSPIDGIAGVRQVDLGNLVTPPTPAASWCSPRWTPSRCSSPSPGRPPAGLGGLLPGLAPGRGLGPRRPGEAGHRR
jgi:multidrug resistance efflux pump